MNLDRIKKLAEQKADSLEKRGCDMWFGLYYGFIFGWQVCESQKDLATGIELPPYFISNVGIEHVDVVNLDTAKFLKSLGYNKPSYWYWQDWDEVHLCTECGTKYWFRNGAY